MAELDNLLLSIVSEEEGGHLFNGAGFVPRRNWSCFNLDLARCDQVRCERLSIILMLELFLRLLRFF